MDALRSYEQFFINNEEMVNNVESLLQVGFSFTPTRFGGNTEVVTEAGFLKFFSTVFHHIIHS